MAKIYKNKSELIDDFIDDADIVLDAGFWGQGVGVNSNNWVHKMLLDKAKEVYGIDVDFDLSKLADIGNYKQNYKKRSAENFDFRVKFDVIFAGDIIEHLSNPGLFLKSCAKNLKNGGRLIITTPNCFNLFHLAEKISKAEPTVNPDHVCYFNAKTLRRLLEKNGWRVKEIAYLHSLGVDYPESYKKKFLNVLYSAVSKFTPKFLETLTIVAEKI
ncbi:class I SAM-dependent methyltransferase [Candidatus Azambacteria bacterium]|nr:class I SAM-dependent methyltransferase [Candidatus Azambacteria bacterium]